MDLRRGAVGTQQMTRARTEPCPATKGSPGADRLSALSDELLLHILSFLGIRTAISTSCLSRRWRYLYHYLSSLDFSGGWDQDSVRFIDRVLLLHAAPRIESFRLFIRVEIGNDLLVCDRHIDSWLLFAVRRGVRVLDLKFQIDDPRHPSSNECSYGLPSWVFRCRTLEDFSVRNCYLLLPGHSRLSSLKKMRLSLTEFLDDELMRLLLGCPLLQSLELEDCNEASDLVIDARESRRLEELVIIDGIDYDPAKHNTTQIKIDAPSVQYLRFRGVSFRRKYEVRDLSSLDVASFDLDETGFLYEDEAEVFTTGRLLRIPQVRVLKLCMWSLQVCLLGSSLSGFPTFLGQRHQEDGDKIYYLFLQSKKLLLVRFILSYRAANVYPLLDDLLQNFSGYPASCNSSSTFCTEKSNRPIRFGLEDQTVQFNFRLEI